MSSPPSGNNDDPTKEPSRVPCPKKLLVERIWKNGANTLADTELLALLLLGGNVQQEVLELTHELFHRAGSSIHTLCKLSSWELIAVPGIDRTTATVILAACELSRRRNVPDPEQRPLVTNSTIAYSILKPALMDLEHEELWALFLDQGSRLIAREKISRGGLNATVIDARVIFRMAIERRSSAIILGHNHPSGLLYPSEMDKKLTDYLKAVAHLAEVEIKDHLIITCQGFFSFLDEGLIS